LIIYRKIACSNIAYRKIEHRNITHSKKHLFGLLPFSALLWIHLIVVLNVIACSKPEPNNYGFELIDKIIQADVEVGFPGGQLVVVHHGQVIKNTNYGYVSNFTEDGEPLVDKIPVNSDTMYDLASNTKMYSANYAIQMLVYQKKISLNDKIQKYFDDFIDAPEDAIKGKDDLTIETILHHSAGFPPDPRYHNNNYLDLSQTLDPDTPVNLFFSQNKSDTWKQIVRTPLQYPPGTEVQYSDVDYMILGFLIEKVTGTPLDQYVKDNIYDPLGLKHISFNPLDYGYPIDNIAATELNGNSRGGEIDFVHIRHGVIQGTVHDEKSFYSMGGVSGHAGLFSNASDLAKLAGIMLSGGISANGVQLFDSAIIDEFTQVPNPVDDTFGLGWRRQGGDKGYSRIFSDLASVRAFGHTGWTGTLTIIDPKTDTVIVYLTNKKNTPITGLVSGIYEFAGDCYVSAKYSNIARLVYMSILGYPMDYDLIFLTGIINTQKDRLKDDEWLGKDYIQKSADAAEGVLREYKDYAVVKEYFKEMR